ncbi:barrel cupin 2 domain-containing protein [Escherichia coli]|nr:barrel cupin 2 domain-containing protein [Escherichia coli]
MHNHPHEQLTYVLSGEFEFTIGEEKQIVTAGDTLYKAPHVMHGCICPEARHPSGYLYAVRDDFLK